MTIEMSKVKISPLLVILGLLMGFESLCSASPKEDVQKVVESFYAQYYKEYSWPTGQE